MEELINYITKLVHYILGDKKVEIIYDKKFVPKSLKQFVYNIIYENKDKDEIIINTNNIDI